VLVSNNENPNNQADGFFLEDSQTSSAFLN